MAAWIWVVIVIAVVAVIALAVVGSRKRRTAVLRDRFGPEYDRTVENSDGRRAAEAELRDREHRRAEFDIKPLPESARLSYANEWQEVQEHFVDERGSHGRCRCPRYPRHGSAWLSDAGLRRTG